MYRKVYLLITFILHFISCFGQTTIKMQKKNGVYIIPCKVNGLALEFVFDTGAGDVSISLTEALFMYKQGNLKELDFGGLKLNNVEASIVHTLSAPLLLGQSAISKLGKIQIDPSNNTLTILDNANSNVKKPPTEPTKEAPKIVGKKTIDQSKEESPCLKTPSKKGIKYSTKVWAGTWLYDQPSNNGKKIKHVVTGISIDVIDDHSYGEYALVSYNGCYGYIMKFGLEKFH